MYALIILLRNHLCSRINSLGALEVPVNDLMVVQVLHALRDLFGPASNAFRRYFVPILDEIEERPVRAELHDDAEHGRRGAHTPATRAILINMDGVLHTPLQHEQHLYTRTAWCTHPCNTSNTYTHGRRGAHTPAPATRAIRMRTDGVVRTPLQHEQHLYAQTASCTHHCNTVNVQNIHKTSCQSKNTAKHNIINN